MSDLVTLRQLTGLPTEPAPLAESALIMIDLQNTYTRDTLELDGVQAAIEKAAALLDRARTEGATVVHIMHDAGVGTPYDVTAEIGQIVDAVAPREGEPVLVKNFPNSFVGTTLDEELRKAGRTDVVLAGFMAHMCVNSTARGAFNLGYRPTVVENATATRPLPGPPAVDSASLKASSMAMIGDLFGIVVPDAEKFG